LLYITGMFRLL